MKISAKEDLIHIKDYIFRKTFSLHTSNEIYNEIMANIVTLKIFPSMYPLYQDDLRVLTVRGKYRIFYKISESEKEVIVYYIFSSEQNYHSLIH